MIGKIFSWLKIFATFTVFKRQKWFLHQHTRQQPSNYIIIYPDAIKLYCYSERLSECSGVLRGLLDHHQVRGKPILLLANKSDVDTAQVGHVTAILVPHWSMMMILVCDWAGRGGGGVAAGYRGAGELRPVPHQGGVQRGHQEPGAAGGIQGEWGLVLQKVPSEAS